MVQTNNSSLLTCIQLKHVIPGPSFGTDLFAIKRKMMFKLRSYLEEKIQQPKDVYSAIYPLFMVCNVIGLAPYSLKKIENGKRAFQFALLPVLRSILLVAVFLSLLGFQVFDQSPIATTSEIKDKVRYFQEIFAAIFSSFEIIAGCFFTFKIIEVFKNIDQVDAGFRKLAVWVPYKGIYLYIIGSLIFIGVGHVTGICALVWLKSSVYDKYFTLSATYDSAMSLTTALLPYFINVLMEVQYVHYLNILRLRYKLLNEYLEALLQKNVTAIDWKTGPMLIESKEQQFRAESKSPKGIISISDPIFVVDQVVGLHIKLTDTAHLINYAFCVQQLMRITLAFVSIVTALFLIAMNFSSNVAENIQPDLMFTFWAFSNGMEVVMIVWITSETSEEANTCPRILHKIRNNTTNVKLQDTIEIYSLQMYHNRLYFTVCGLFPLDYTLLYTIVAGVTTYLVILIQFNIEFVKTTNSTTKAI